MSETIEKFIKQMLAYAEGETIDIQRNELANQLGCVPSQINYVISTRFTNDHGYIVESRRGGGGYIRIKRMQFEKPDYLAYIAEGIGDSVTAAEAEKFAKSCLEAKLMSEREFRLIMSAVGDGTLAVNRPHRDMIRAKILKNMLLTLISR